MADRKTVLVVDDNEELLASVQLSMKYFGDFVVETARDGVEGLTKVMDSRPDCVVIDVVMPGLDGLQLVRAIRGDPETATIPLVILSALAQPVDMMRGFVSGVDQYLHKPLDPQALVQAIQTAFTFSPEDRQRAAAALLEEDFPST